MRDHSLYCVESTGRFDSNVCEQQNFESCELCNEHLPCTGLLHGVSTLMQYFVVPLNGSKYYLMYTFKAVLGILGPSKSLLCNTLETLAKTCKLKYM